MPADMIHQSSCLTEDQVLPNGGPPFLPSFPVTKFVTGASARGAEGGCGPPGRVDVGVGGGADVEDDDDVDGIGLGLGLYCCPAPPTGGTLTPP